MGPHSLALSSTCPFDRTLSVIEGVSGETRFFGTRTNRSPQSSTK